jgi:hypothetical protein
MDYYEAYMYDNDKEKPMFSEKKIVPASFRTSQIPKWNGLGLNPGLRRERPATNRGTMARSRFCDSHNGYQSFE